MCPVCLANMALIAAGATSGGGLLTVFARKKLPTKVGGKKITNQTKREENEIKQ